MKKKIIFLHIPKNGGNTFHSILERFYPQESTFTIESKNNVLNTDEFLSLSVERRKKIELLKGHLFYGIHKYLPGDTTYITFLRNPVERIISLYYYIQRRKEHRLHDKICKNNMSLYDFVTEVKEPEMHNGQIRMISGITDKETFMLEKAIENIEKKFTFVGITEQYNESLVLLKKKLDWPLPYYQYKNKTNNRPLSENCNIRTINAINKLNKGDIIIYNKFVNTLNNKIKGVNDLNYELKKINIANQIYTKYKNLKIKGSKMLRVSKSIF